MSFTSSGSYKIQEWHEEKGTFYDQAAWSYGMHVEVLDPEGKAQLSRVLAGSSASYCI